MKDQRRKGKPHLHPTRKWWAAQIAAVTTLTTGWVSAGHWDKPLSLAAIGVVSQAAIAYIVPNVDPATRTARGSTRDPVDATPLAGPRADVVWSVPTGSVASVTRP